MAALRVEPQGDMECALSTMAALTGRALADVRGVARVAEDATGRPFFSHPTLRTLADLLDPSGVLRDLCGGYPPGRLASAVSGDRVRLLSTRRRSLPAHGRGTIRLINRHDRFSGHIMPWQDGLAYDPADPAVGRTLAEVRAGNRWARVGHITCAS